MLDEIEGVGATTLVDEQLSPAEGEPEPKMYEEPDTTDAAEETSDTQVRDVRERSTIAFPYAGLSEAEVIAQELHGFGGSATPDGIAGGLDQSTRSGAFRQKMSAARIFGLVTTRPGAVSLTQLGKNIIDPERTDAARVEAFLHVPLFKAIFDEYNGNLLPPPAALEDRMVTLGVSPKQAAVARQVFQRSGELAGFFRRGANRLTLPDVETTGYQSADTGAKGNGAQDAMNDAIQALWFTLLRDGESWSAEQTKQYVDGARKVYAVLGEQH